MHDPVSHYIPIHVNIKNKIYSCHIERKTINILYMKRNPFDAIVIKAHSDLSFNFPNSNIFFLWKFYWVYCQYK